MFGRIKRQEQERANMSEWTEEQEQKRNMIMNAVADTLRGPFNTIVDNQQIIIELLGEIRKHQQNEENKND